MRSETEGTHRGGSIEEGDQSAEGEGGGKSEGRETAEVEGGHVGAECRGGEEGGMRWVWGMWTKEEAYCYRGYVYRMNCSKRALP